MIIVSYRAESTALPRADFMFLAVIVHGTDFHPVTPFRSALSAEDAAAKAQAWWDEQLAAVAKTEAGKAARAAALAKRRKGAIEPEDEIEDVI